MPSQHPILVIDDDTALRLAGHLAELAWLAAPDDPAIAEVRRSVFTRRAGAASSTIVIAAASMHRTTCSNCLETTALHAA